MRKYIVELLTEINDEPKKLEQFMKDGSYNGILTVLLQYAFDPAKKWILPDGEPPFKQAPEPMGMTETNVYAELRRLYIFCRADLKPIKRESMFIGLLESVHPKEAEMFIAIKDQKLHKLYPKITRKLVESVGIVQPLPKKS